MKATEVKKLLVKSLLRRGFARLKDLFLKSANGKEVLVHLRKDNFTVTMQTLGDQHSPYKVEYTYKLSNIKRVPEP